MIKDYENYIKNKTITAEEYFHNDKYAVDIFNTKYAQNVNGKLETPAETFWRVAKNAALMEKENKQQKYANIFFDLLWDGWFRAGGSIIASLGINKKCSTMNCTTLPIAEDTLEAIGQCEYETMKCAAWRQGIGIDFSNLRPRGSKVANAAEESTGVIPWMDKINRIGDYVGQKGRKPALLESLIISHPDIEEFIECKNNLKQINNANISVQITNEFMKAVENDTEWELSFTINNKERISKKVSAKKLFNKIATQAFKSAEPGIQYRDLLQNALMYKAIYDETKDKKFLPHSSNACSEKFMAPYSVCNLSSINMGMFSIKKEDYQKELESIIPYIVRFADNIIEYELKYNLSPIPQQKEIVTLLREIGLGITNVHKWLLNQELPYDSDEAIKVIEDFMSYYAYIVFKSSIELGKEKGNAPAFELLKDKKSLMNTTYCRNIVNKFFEGDINKVTHMRNMAHMSIAPSGSISSVFPTPCLSSGIEPLISHYYWRRTRAVDKGKYTYYFIIPDEIKKFLINYIRKQEKYDEQDIALLENFNGSVLDDDGTIGKKYIKIFEKYLPADFLKPAHKIDPLQKVKLMSSIYKWIDASISCTFNLPTSATVKDIEEIYYKAYEKGVRAVSVYVDGSREGILIFDDPMTHKKKYGEIIDTEGIVTKTAPKRPEVLPCDIHHCMIKGQKWLVLIGLFNSEPYEVFAGESDDIYLPKTVKNGSIIKKSKGIYSLVTKIRNAEIEFKNIANLLMNGEQRALTRLISTSLRHGVPREFIIEQLKKASKDLTEFAVVVSRVLSMYAGKQISYKDLCPICKEPMMKEEGCLKCYNCNYSKCG